MIVTLNGQAKYAQSIRAGIYVLAPNLVNDKPHWLQDQGSNAIWHRKRYVGWRIGNLGSSLGGLYSTDDEPGPQEASTWNYYNYDKKWITSDDILVDIFVEPGMYITGEVGTMIWKKKIQASILISPFRFV